MFFWVQHEITPFPRFKKVSQLEKPPFKSHITNRGNPRLQRTSHVMNREIKRENWKRKIDPSQLFEQFLSEIMSNATFNIESFAPEFFHVPMALVNRWGSDAEGAWYTFLCVCYYVFFLVSFNFFLQPFEI